MRAKAALTALAAGALAACVTMPSVDPARLAALTPELGQLVLVGVGGTQAEGDAEIERLLCELRVGGILLFARNITDETQVARFTTALRERAGACAGRRLLIAVDAEGGRVMRLGPTAGYSPVFSAEELGQANDFTMTELEARRIAVRLRAAGIDWNLAPVVDVGYNPANPVIVGTGRSFSANPLLVTTHARVFIRAMRQEGILTALKHFPGHGSSFADSHRGFVDVTDTANPEVELVPYRTLIAEGIVESVMTAHVVNRRLDPDHPATLSRAAITGVLRQGLGFNGLVVSDDLRMGAIEQHYGLGEAAVRALAAGVDVLLIADDRLPDGGSAAAIVVAAVGRALARGRLDPARVETALAHAAAFRARLPDATIPR